MTEDEADHVDDKIETASRNHGGFAELCAALAIKMMFLPFRTRSFLVNTSCE